MTDTKPLAPTDAEIIAVLRPLYASDEAASMGAADDLRTSRAVLAKWGVQPVPASAAEFALRALVAAGHITQERVDQAMALPGAPAQPVAAPLTDSQAQAGAVPLTCEWAHNEDDGFWDTECGQSWLFDDGGPKENHMNFCHCCGKPLRIKGGQHGTE